MKSYFKFLSRNKLYTAIEAVGLVVSLAFVIIIGSSIRDQLGVVYHVPDHNNLYLVGPASGGSIFGEYSAINQLATIPEIRETAAFQIGQGLVQIGGENHVVALGMMDSNLPDMISLRVLSGSEDPFEGGEGVAITASAARRYFPGRNPVGEPSIGPGHDTDYIRYRRSLLYDSRRFRFRCKSPVEALPFGNRCPGIGYGA